MPGRKLRKRHDWRVLGASVIGQAHSARGMPNQDALATASGPGGSLLLAVADGAGSAPLSDQGALLACQTAVAALAALDLEEPEAALRGALSKASQAVHSQARRAGKPARDYACTLLLALATPEWVSGLQLGDGAIIVQSGGQPSRLTPGWRSSYAGETVFITSPDAPRLASVASRQAAEVEALALLTDGLEPVATDLGSGQPFAPFFEPLFSFTVATSESGVQALRNRQLADLLGSERVRLRTHDDTTLLLAARGES